MMGASWGGYNAAYFCVKANDYFHMIGMNSAYLHPIGDYNIDIDLQAANLDGMKLYLSYGTFDVQGEQYFYRLKNIFDQKGKDYDYNIIGDGHTWENWSRVVGKALEYFFSDAENSPPVVANIPNQTIQEGNSFATIQLDNFVTDPDNVDSEISWSYTGNNELSISIDGNRIATITTPNSEWNGSETITFIATDPEGDSGSDDVIFTVTNINDGPVISDIPDQIINEGSSFATINLDNFVTDPDNEDSEITWSFSGYDKLSVDVDGNRVATVSIPDENWNGNETINFTAKDPGNVSNSRAVSFTVNPVNDPPVISGAPELVEFVSDTSATVDIRGLTSDVETSNDLLLYTFNTDSDSILFFFDDATGILTLSAELEFGGEGNLIWSISDSEAIVEDTIHIVVEKAIVIGVDDDLALPEEFALFQNYPNPFNPSTMIKYAIPANSEVRIEIFNMLGQSVSLLVNSEKPAGYYETNWDASNLPSGTYIYRIISGTFTESRKMLLLR